MSPSYLALRMIEQEMQGLMQRIALTQPFALQETMVPAATPAGTTLLQIDRQLGEGRQRFLANAQGFLRWLRSAGSANQALDQIYRRFVLHRLEANATLAQFDLFSDALTQRSETQSGVWLAGLDQLALDALDLPQRPYEVPPVLTYLDRGIGAAIRRARTRLPGGGESPVALIRVPRERMVGLGIASSLVHEAGHQGAALLDLVPWLRQRMDPLLLDPRNPGERNPWAYWNRWISEIVADLWSVSRLGIASTLGLINVVSLPRVFVFRSNLSDPHPTPWVRVLVSAHIGRQLYPHPQWDQVIRLWMSYYPMGKDDGPQSDISRMLARHAPVFARWLVAQPMGQAFPRPLAESLSDARIAPARLEEWFEQWRREPLLIRQLRPCQVFALVGYAKFSGRRLPAPEVPLFSDLLTRWALNKRLVSA